MRLFKVMLAAAVLFGGAVYAGKGPCELSQHGAVKVGWKAYKTPLKIGVGGTFGKVEYAAAALSGHSFRDILVGSEVVIDPASVDSKNTGRDRKLVRYFFEKMAGEKIKAEIVDIKAEKIERGKPKLGVVTVAVTMNGMTKKVPMRYRYFKGVMTAEGTIDLADFDALGALASINKACFDLHQGKTWSDVTVTFEMQISATLCHPAAN